MGQPLCGKCCGARYYKQHADVQPHTAADAAPTQQSAFAALQKRRRAGAMLPADHLGDEVRSPPRTLGFPQASLRCARSFSSLSVLSREVTPAPLAHPRGGTLI